MNENDRAITRVFSKLCFTDCRLIYRTHDNNKQFVLSLWTESYYIFYKFNPLNTDTFYVTLSIPIVRINGVDCI